MFYAAEILKISADILDLRGLVTAFPLSLQRKLLNLRFAFQSSQSLFPYSANKKEVISWGRKFPC